MKRFFALALSLMIMLSLCSCGGREKFDEYKKIAANLYEVTCDEYDYDYLLSSDGFGNVDIVGGCSAIKQGNFLGRNFDYVAKDAAEIVVKTTAKNGRFASIGMVGGMLWLSSEFMDAGLDDDAKKLIPLMVLDGINEKGLAIETNCVNTADVGGRTLQTNPGKDKVAQLCLTRYLLDNAASADEAVQMMKNIDIVSTRDVLGLINFNFETHFLVADKNKSYVVEFDNTKPDGEKLIIMEDETVSTNFYLHLASPENGVFPAHSMGVERYRKIVDNRNSVDSVESMKTLMQSIRFSNSNRLDGEYAPGKNFDNPYTCLSDHPVFDNDAINYANMRENLPEIVSKMKEDDAAVKKLLKDPDLYNPNNLWVTSHNTVYDLENKTMSVAVYERYDKYYDYSLK